MSSWPSSSACLVQKPLCSTVLDSKMLRVQEQGGEAWDQKMLTVNLDDPIMIYWNISLLDPGLVSFLPCGGERVDLSEIP